MSKFLDKIDSTLRHERVVYCDAMYATFRETVEKMNHRQFRRCDLGVKIHATCLCENETEIEYHKKKLKAQIAKEVYSDVVDEVFSLYNILRNKYMEPEVRDQIEKILGLMRP